MKNAKDGKLKNEHVPKLKTEQQLQLRTIQRRSAEYRAQAGQHVEMAHALVKQAEAANLEFSTALQGFIKSMGVDVARLGFDYDKLEFLTESEMAAAKVAAEQKQKELGAAPSAP